MVGRISGRIPDSETGRPVRSEDVGDIQAEPAPRNIVETENPAPAAR